MQEIIKASGEVLKFLKGIPLSDITIRGYNVHLITFSHIAKTVESTNLQTKRLNNSSKAKCAVWKMANFIHRTSGQYGGLLHC